MPRNVEFTEMKNKMKKLIFCRFIIVTYKKVVMQAMKDLGEKGMYNVIS